ncbi:MAG: hypothetical protein ACYC19_08740 [Acidimicrobiales bacterium]
MSALLLDAPGLFAAAALGPGKTPIMINAATTPADPWTRRATLASRCRDL